MKKVIAKYLTTVYSDGSLEHELVEQYGQDQNDNEVITSEQVSSRIKQIMAVIWEWVHIKEKDTGNVRDCADIMTEAVRKVSEREEISYSSVCDKISRQCFGSTSEFVLAVEQFDRLKGYDKPSLESRLKAIASTRTTDADRKYISQELKSIVEQFYEEKEQGK